MQTDALVLLLVSVTLVWGSLALSVRHAVRASRAADPRPSTAGPQGPHSGRPDGREVGSR
jgi:hypothetical protein